MLYYKNTSRMETMVIMLLVTVVGKMTPTLSSSTSCEGSVATAAFLISTTPTNNNILRQQQKSYEFQHPRSHDHQRQGRHDRTSNKKANGILYLLRTHNNGMENDSSSIMSCRM